MARGGPRSGAGRKKGQATKMNEAARKAVWSAIDPSFEGIARTCAQQADETLAAMAADATP